MDREPTPDRGDEMLEPQPDAAAVARERRYFEAVELARKGRFAEATQEFRRILEEDPTHIGSRGQIAYFHFLFEELDEAIECYREICDLHPDLAIARLKLADCYLARGNRRQAHRMYLSLQGTEFFSTDEVQEKLGLTEFLPRRVLRRLFPILGIVFRRLCDGSFLRALLRETAALPRAVPAIRDAGVSSYLSFLSRHYLRSTSYRHPLFPCDLCGGTRCRAIFYHRDRKIVRCLGCGLEFLERKPVEGMDVTTDRYSQDETLEGYEGETWRDPKIHQERLRLLTSLFEQAEDAFPQEGGRAFEIGFGDGAFLAFLGDRGYTVSGIETSERLVQHAIREHGLEVATGTVASLEAEPKRYDLVLAYHVLEHLDRPSLLFQKANEMLRNGGYLFIEIPVANLSKMSRAKKLDEMIGYANPNHMHFFTKTVVPKYFENHGFEVVGSYILYPDTHPTGGYLGKKH